MSKPRIEWLERQIAKIEDRVLARELGYLIDYHQTKQAAAQELAQALSEAVADLSYLCPERFDDYEHERNWNAKLERLRAVITKHEGEPAHASRT